ncbi:glutathione S-transferase theta-1-like [Spea bombifrons]|uniref:glutathione S-transferase theta-1-like n=1 Tax=Spea bombifrons TaxID=233779 RepID=UPI0023498639|nr:glutathione S-transferase theta-1-like [Spea bombifrons]
MSGIVLYLDLLSQPSRAIYIFSKVNKIPFHYHEVQLFQGGHLTGEFEKVNPLRKVPVLKDGDFTLIESTAILLYLVNKYKTPDHWYPSDLQKRARVDEYLAWQHTNTHHYSCRVFWVKCMTPVIFGHEVSPEKLQQVLAEFNAIMTQLEKLFLKDQLFLAGDEISLADLVAMADIMQVIASGVPIFEDRPKLGAWKQRVVDALGSELFKEAHEGILNVKEQQLESLSPEMKKIFKAKLLIFSQ